MNSTERAVQLRLNVRPKRGVIKGGLSGMNDTQNQAPNRLLPTDVRSVLLLVGYLGLLVVGVVNLFEQDWTGTVPILAAIAGAFFVRGRLLSIGIWLGVAVFGLSIVAQRDLGGVVPLGVGLLGAVVGAWPDAELLRSLQPARSPSAAEEADEETEEAEAPAAFSIRSVGRIQLLAGDEDLSAVLAERRLINFALLRLLAMWVAGDDPYITRDRLSEELWPRLDVKTRRSRLRNLLHDFGELSAERPALSDRLQVRGELVTFNLQGCDFDVARLIDLAGEARGPSDVLSRRVERRARRLLDELGTGMFLPGWEELQQRVTGGRDASRQVVDTARARVSNLRADLALAVARTSVVSGRPGDGIAYLERALEAAADREDVAAQLRTLYFKTGQDDKAKAVREEYGLKELV